MNDAGSDEVFTSVIVAAEMRFGALRKASPGLTMRIDEMLQRIRIEPFDVPAVETYARLRLALQRAGTPIGANDMFIAAQALASDSILVTDNISEFARVPGLKIENWLR
jgi:tRNA(fMet)-specific endonuclease VapC